MDLDCCKIKEGHRHRRRLHGVAVEVLIIGDDYLTARVGMSLLSEYRSTSLRKSSCAMMIFRSHHF